MQLILSKLRGLKESQLELSKLVANSLCNIFRTNQSNSKAKEINVFYSIYPCRVPTMERYWEILLSCREVLERSLVVPLPNSNKQIVINFNARNPYQTGIVGLQLISILSLVILNIPAELPRLYYFTRWQILLKTLRGQKKGPCS